MRSEKCFFLTSPFIEPALQRRYHLRFRVLSFGHASPPFRSESYLLLCGFGGEGHDVDKDAEKLKKPTLYKCRGVGYPHGQSSVVSKYVFIFGFANAMRPFVEAPNSLRTLARADQID